MTSMPVGRSPAAVAGWLVRAHATGRRFEPFAAACGITTIDAAYDVQRAYVTLLARSRNAALAGYKIGLTSGAMQAMCGIDTPVAGSVLADRVHASGCTLRRSDHGRLGVEFELAVRIGRDVLPSERPFTLAGMAAAIDAVAPAIEIVDDRGCDYATLDVCSLIADNAWNAGIVLGAFRSSWPDLASVVGRVSVDGAGVRHQGQGRDVLGHPLHPVLWLAEHLAATDEHLRAGQVVMTGSMVATQFPEGPGRFSFDARGLGSVEVTVVS